MFLETSAKTAFNVEEVRMKELNKIIFRHLICLLKLSLAISKKIKLI
jgi:hypothetical protein